MAKIQCKFCKAELNSRCNKKNSSVKLNKHRVCKDYEVDVPRVTAFVEKKMSTSKPEVMIRPDGWWDRKERRIAKQTVKSEDLSGFETTATAVIPSIQTNLAYPLTGDLSRFIVPEEVLPDE